jgi:hypothetical protein
VPLQKRFERGNLVLCAKLDFLNDGAHRSCRIPIALLFSVRNNPSSISTTRVRLQRHINIIYRQQTVSPSLFSASAAPRTMHSKKQSIQQRKKSSSVCLMLSITR